MKYPKRTTWSNGKITLVDTGGPCIDIFRCDDDGRPVGHALNTLNVFDYEAYRRVSDNEVMCRIQDTLASFDSDMYLLLPTSV